MPAQLLTVSDIGSLVAPLSSPAFTDTPTAPTAATANNTTQLATTAFVQQELAAGGSTSRSLVVSVRNQSGGTMTAGTVVYINGSTGNLPTIAKAIATSDATSAQTLGLVQTSIANNGTGLVVVRGILGNLNTSGLTEGQQLYLSPTTAGMYTTTKQYAPNHLVYIGIVTRAHPTQGSIEVAVQNGFEMDELHNVSAQSPANGDTLRWNAATSLWEKSALGTLATQSGTFSGTSSGTNTGDQTIGLTGDVTGSGTGSFAATIAANAVTNAKAAQVATQTLKGRNTAGTGNVEDLSVATVKTMLNLAGTNTGNQTATTVPNTPAGGIASTTVQAALNELSEDITRNDYADAVDSLAAESFTPIITQATGESTALSSPVVYKPYICGTGAQVLDSNGQGDMYIRFDPGTFNSGAGGSNDLAMYGSIKPGGDASYARWPVIARFTTSSSNSVVEIGFYSADNNDQIFPLIEVNGRPLQDYCMRRTVAGSGWKFTMTFPTAQSRTIALYCVGSAGITAIRVPTGQSISKPAAPSSLIAFIGDSFCNGAGVASVDGALISETFPRRLGRYLCQNSFILAGIGGTGFTAGGVTSNYLSRASYVSSKSPNILIVNGSINDGTGAGTLAADVSAFLSACSTIPRVIVIGTMVAGYEANHAAVKAATLSAGREFVDMASFMSVGGQPTYFYSDSVHPSFSGHGAIARSIYRKISNP